jgi:hypothetical protein
VWEQSWHTTLTKVAQPACDLLIREVEEAGVALWPRAFRLNMEDGMVASLSLIGDRDFVME